MAPKTRKGLAASRRIAKAITAAQLRTSARLKGKTVEAEEVEAEAEGSKRKKRPWKRAGLTRTAASSLTSVTTSGESSKSTKKKAKEAKAAKDNAVKEKQLEENKTGGLKLHKRGMVTMATIAQRLTRGKKLTVQITEKGEPFGKVAGEMQSYIGVLARTTIPINIKEWRLVDEAHPDAKQKIWEAIQEAFIVPPELRKAVIKSAGTKWRDFKSYLTRLYIMPYINQPELLEYPPEDYRCIAPAVWDDFVRSRLTEQFQAIREEQIQKAKLNLYPHHLSRGGYANLQAKLAETIPISELCRGILWGRARMDKDGNFVTPEVAKIAKNIDELKKQEEKGEFKSEGSHDVLAEALGSEEHPGRVRGVGGYVNNPDTYFNMPPSRKRKRNSVTERVMKMLVEERRQWLLEKTSISEELADLKARVLGKEKSADAAKPVTPIADLNSAQGSCPSRPNEEAEEKDGSKVKKKLDLGEPLTLDVNNEPIRDVEEVNHEKLESILEDQVNDFVLPKSSINNDVVPTEENQCGLAIETGGDIVAYGKIIHVDVESSKQVIHGVALGEENIRVEIVGTVVHDAKIPIPVSDDEIVTVTDALGSFIPWPRHLVIVTPAAPKSSTQKVANKKKKVPKYVYEDREDLKTLPKSVPTQLRLLCTWANTALVNGVTVYTVFDPEIFGYPRKAALSRKELYQVAHMDEASGTVIVYYISHLHKLLKQSKMVEMFGFVDPSHVARLAAGNMKQRAAKLCDRYRQGSAGQIWLIPYNPGDHWVLTIVKLDDESVFYMDPMRKPCQDVEWMTIVENSIKLYKNQTTDKLKWKNLAGIPKQFIGNGCAYFVMFFMKSIINDNSLDFRTKWEYRGKAGNLKCTQKDIDQVIGEWAGHVLGFGDGHPVHT